jgi:hypothetical protein
MTDGRVTESPENGDFTVFPVTPFSWSPTRLGIFKLCQRRCFYKHYGWEDSVSGVGAEKHSLIKTLKNLKTAPRLLSEIFAETLRGAFLSGDRSPSCARAVSASDFTARLAGAAALAAMDIERGAWRADPKKPNLYEIYHGAAPAKKASAALRTAAKKAGEIFVSGQLFKELTGLSPLQFKQLRPPQSFRLAGITVWAAPDLVWEDRGVLTALFVRASADFDAEGYETAPEPGSAVTAMLLREKFLTPPERISLALYCPARGDDDFTGRFPVKKESLPAAAKIIRESSAAMLAKLRGGSARESDFPETSNPQTACPLCEFKTLCGRGTPL